MRKIKITEAELKRLVQKVIKESYGPTAAGGLGFGEGNPNDIGLGYGFDEPIISQFSGGGSEMDLDEAPGDEDDTTTDDTDTTTDDTDTDTTKVQSGSDKYSEADIQAVKLVISGKKQLNQLTVNQRKLYAILK